MDKQKEPGINVDAIILEESFFKRKQLVPDGFKNNVEFKIKNSIDPVNKRMITEFTVDLNKKDSPIYMHLKFIGIFSVSENKNMTLEEFAENGSPQGIIFPYAREEIQNRMVKAYLPNYSILPPMNFTIKNQKKDSDLEKNPAKKKV